MLVFFKIQDKHHTIPSALGRVHPLMGECAMIVGTGTLDPEENSLFSRIKYKHPIVQKGYEMMILI